MISEIVALNENTWGDVADGWDNPDSILSQSPLFASNFRELAYPYLEENKQKKVSFLFVTTVRLEDNIRIDFIVCKFAPSSLPGFVKAASKMTKEILLIGNYFFRAQHLLPEWIQLITVFGRKKSSVVSLTVNHGHWKGFLSVWQIWNHSETLLDWIVPFEASSTFCNANIAFLQKFVVCSPIIIAFSVHVYPMICFHAPTWRTSIPCGEINEETNSFTP